MVICSARNVTILTTVLAGPPGDQQLGPKSVAAAAVPRLGGLGRAGLTHSHQRRKVASAVPLAIGEYPMIRAKLCTLAAMALVAAGAMASAQAQTQTASAEPTIWDH